MLTLGAPSPVLLLTALLAVLSVHPACSQLTSYTDRDDFLAQLDTLPATVDLESANLGTLPSGLFSSPDFIGTNLYAQTYGTASATVVSDGTNKALDVNLPQRSCWLCGAWLKLSFRRENRQGFVAFGFHWKTGSSPGDPPLFFYPAGTFPGSEVLPGSSRLEIPDWGADTEGFFGIILHGSDAGLRSFWLGDKSRESVFQMDDIVFAYPPVAELYLEKEEWEGRMQSAQPFGAWTQENFNSLPWPFAGVSSGDEVSLPINGDVVNGVDGWDDRIPMGYIDLDTSEISAGSVTLHGGDGGNNYLEIDLAPGEALKIRTISGIRALGFLGWLPQGDPAGVPPILHIESWEFGTPGDIDLGPESFTAAAFISIPDLDPTNWFQDTNFVGFVFPEFDGPNPDQNKFDIREIEIVGQEGTGSRFFLDSFLYTLAPLPTIEWELLDANDAPERVVARSVGLCLTVDVENHVKDGNGDFEYAPVRAKQCDGSDEQKLAYAGGDGRGKFGLRTASIGLFLDDVSSLNPSPNALCLIKTATGEIRAVTCDWTDAGININNGDGDWIVEEDEFIVRSKTDQSICMKLGTETSQDSGVFSIVADTCSLTDELQKFDWSGSVGDPLLNFATSLRSTKAYLGVEEDPNIGFRYMYAGPPLDHSFLIGGILNGVDEGENTFTANFIRYSIFEEGCKDLVAGYVDEDGERMKDVLPDLSHELFVRDIVYVQDEDFFIAPGFTPVWPSNGYVDIDLGIDLNRLEDSSFWFQGDDQRKAELRFCGRFEIFYMDMMVNFHEVAFTAKLTLTEDRGFNIDELDAVNMDRAEQQEARPNVSVDYPVDVVFCADDTTTIENPPSIITQGFPIQLCISLDEDVAAANPNVYVLDIDNLKYYSEHSTNGATQETTAISGGVPDVITELDCSKGNGICKVKFIPLALYFDTTTANRNGATNRLKVSGDAVIAFGSDPSQRRTLKVSMDRVLQQEASVVAGDGLSRMDQDLGLMKMNNPRKNNKNSGAFSSGVVGWLVPAMIGAFGYLV